MVLAEDLLLLLLEPERGKPVVDATKLDNALAGSLLLELALHGRVDVVDSTSWWSRAPRLTVATSTPVGQPLLDGALRTIVAKEGSKPQDAIPALRKKLRDRLVAGLVDNGTLREEQHKVLGIFTTTHRPVADMRYVGRLREALRTPLIHDRPAEEREAALICLLSAIDAAPKAVDPQGAADRKLIRNRAKQIAEGHWATGAVRKAIEAVNAATIAAITAAGAAGSNGGS